MMRALAAQTARHRLRWWALALLCGAFFMVIIDGAIVIVALPSTDADLGSASGLQWVISAHALTIAGLLLLGGRAADLLNVLALLLLGRPRAAGGAHRAQPFSDARGQMIEAVRSARYSTARSSGN